MSVFKSEKQKILYINKIRGMCARLDAGKLKSGEALGREICSKHQQLVQEIICSYFDLTLEELRSGKRKERVPFTKSKEWEVLQRRGFHEGASVPGSNIRKVDK